ncbi:MAG: hypothetical protein JXX29_19405 [Deltaproteobacteria bacterium]|nr:hypothetical protein [Deltaproteobacteria bacterium]MBN2673856.1 hypothetical protein [Deltaproteobacteria bacterium]
MQRKKESGVRSSLIHDERGLSTVEYVILLILIAVAGIGLWSTFGETLSGKITNATSQVEGMGGN